MFRSRSLMHFGTLIPSIITLINSTVGVAVLAMPYCFQQCGVLLSVVCLIGTAVVCIASCNMVIGLCITHKGSSIEATCFRYLGITGKRIAEISVIGFMIGSMIGYDVSLADLGAGIVSQVSNTLPPQNLRVVMLALFTVAITPLCLISRVQSLARMSAFAMLFYLVMLLHMIFILGGPKLISDLPTMVWWRPSGLIRCLPIFFASIFCQTQLLTIHTGLHQPSDAVMHQIVQITVVIISIAYGLFGFLGYVAFAHTGQILGNVFLMYPDDPISFCVQAGFLFTVTVSIPLTLFPLRHSLHSFLFHQPKQHACTVDLDIDHEFDVPVRRFRLLTICILVCCFSLSLTTDKIEVIIDLTASLTGSVLGYILPSVATLSAIGFTRSSRDRRPALYLLFVGASLFLIGLFSVAPSSTTTTMVNLPVSPSTIDHKRLFNPNVESGDARRPIAGIGTLPSVLHKPPDENQAPVPKEHLAESVNSRGQHSELLKPRRVKPIPVEVAEPKAPIDLDREVHPRLDALPDGPINQTRPQFNPNDSKFVKVDDGSNRGVRLEPNGGLPGQGNAESQVELKAKHIERTTFKPNDTQPVPIRAPKLPVDTFPEAIPTPSDVKPVLRAKQKIKANTGPIDAVEPKAPAAVGVMITKKPEVVENSNQSAAHESARTRMEPQADSRLLSKPKTVESMDRRPHVEPDETKRLLQPMTTNHAVPVESVQIPNDPKLVKKDQTKVDADQSSPAFKDHIQLTDAVKSNRHQVKSKEQEDGLR